MMIKPPCDFGRTGILEVDDGIFVSVEIRFVEQRSRAMQESGEGKVGVFANPLTIKAGEKRGGGCSIETLVVVEDFYFQ